MTPKQKCEARAKELGIEVEITGGRHFTIELLAPVGKILAGPLLHMTVSEVQFPGTSTQAWQAAFEDMKLGLADCTDAECDYCHEIGS